MILCLENHYKVGDWLYAEFAQQEEPFLALLDAVGSPPTSASSTTPRTPSSAASTRSRSSRKSSTGSSRCTRRTGTWCRGRPWRRSAWPTGPVGYPDKLRHGETGKGANDYDAIFRILKSVNFTGWISVEDGMNGLDELARSVQFLKEKRTHTTASDEAVVSRDQPVQAGTGGHGPCGIMAASA